IIAADNAKFALPEPRVGLAALAGGLQRLPRQIGLKPAMGMILTGRHVGAEEGMALGYVNAVVPQAELMDEARRWAEMILQCSPISIRTSKNVVMQGLDQLDLEGAIKDSRALPSVKELMNSADFEEGPAAFAEKRKPQWQGK
ncbi:MAG: enoyl-CoA hydratase, partial [Gammaproteobacteria bacterium]